MFEKSKRIDCFWESSRILAKQSCFLSECCVFAWGRSAIKAKLYVARQCVRLNTHSHPLFLCIFYFRSVAIMSIVRLLCACVLLGLVAVCAADPESPRSMSRTATSEINQHVTTLLSSTAGILKRTAARSHLKRELEPRSHHLECAQGGKPTHNHNMPSCDWYSSETCCRSDDLQSLMYMAQINETLWSLASIGIWPLAPEWYGRCALCFGFPH